MSNNLSESLRLLVREAYQRRVVMVAGFVAVAAVATLIGLGWPNTYTSYSTVYLEDQSVIAPLLQGAAVQSNLNDRALIAREVIYGRKLLNKVVQASGWKTEGIDAAQLDGIIDGIRQRTMVTNVGDNLVRIEYTDNNPKRAQMVAQKLADFFISESLATKSRESQTAFSFIDQQVKDYQVKLRKLEEGLKNFRTSNVDAQPGAEVDVTHRITELRDRLVQLDQDLRETEIRKASLQSQLNGEADASSVMSRTGEYRRRIGELQTQLDNLLLTYHETYPDVVQLKDQIKELQQAAKRAERNGTGNEVAQVEDAVISNPLYQELRRGLYESNTNIRTLNSRIGETRRLLHEEEARSRRIQSAAAQLIELTRDYEVNTQIYQDLMRRREAARVSMNLDQTEDGATMRIEEPAFLPHTSEGPRQIVFVVAGILLGVLIPVGGLFGLQQVDPRIRHGSAITERLGLPVLGVVPHLHTPREGTAEARVAFSLGVVVLSTLSIIAVISAMRMTGAV